MILAPTRGTHEVAVPPVLDAKAEMVRDSFNRLLPEQRRRVLQVMAQDHACTLHGAVSVMTDLAGALAWLWPVQGPILLTTALVDDVATPFSLTLWRKPHRYRDVACGGPQLLLTSFMLSPGAALHHREQLDAQLRAYRDSAPPGGSGPVP